MPPRVGPYDPPLQTPAPSALAPFRLRAATLTPLAGFSIDARVLSRREYRSDREAELAPIDLALGWGRMRDDAVTARLPVVVCSSKALTAEEQALIRRLHAPFLPKDSLGSAQVARALLDARQAVGVFAREIMESAA